MIDLNDHVPAYVRHGEAKIDLVQDQGPMLVWADGMTRGEIRRAMRVVTANADALLRRWEDLHG